jgi:glutathione peroxidase
MSVFDHSFTDNNGNTVELSQFKGKILLLVNVASQCGFTKQYEGLQALHKKYAKDGLVVIGFPCDQFGGQEPGTDAEIKEFCETNYGVDFLMSTKINVNGEDAHPLFKYVISQSEIEQVDWNFTKFVVSDEVKFIGPKVTPEEMDPHLEGMLKKLSK